MTINQRKKQLETRKEIACGFATLAMLGAFLGGLVYVAHIADQDIEEALATEVETEVQFIEEAEPTEAVIALVDTPIVELGTEEPTTEVSTEIEKVTEVLETETEEIAPKKKYTQDDLKRLARLIYFEDSQCTESMKWCGSVVLNRVASPRYANSIKGVIHEKGQFSVKGYYMTRKVDKTLYAKCESVAKFLLENGSVIPKEVVGMSHYGTFKKYHKKLYKRFGKVYYYSVR